MINKPLKVTEITYYSHLSREILKNDQKAPGVKLKPKKQKQHVRSKNINTKQIYKDIQMLYLHQLGTNTLLPLKPLRQPYTGRCTVPKPQG